MASDAFLSLTEEVSNWGRWGDDDERGALNFIDEAARGRAAAAVVSGAAFPLSLPIDATVPMTLGNKRRFAPVATLISHDVRFLGDDDSAWSEDALHLPLQTGTHWDALAHVSWRQQIYNGFGVETITLDERATRCGIDKVAALVSRGVLLDVARARGVEYCENEVAVTASDLEAACALAGVDVEPGDIVLVRTGAAGRFVRGPGAERKAYVSGAPGFAIAAARWFHARGVAALAVDAQNPDLLMVEEPDMLMPFGVLALRQMGMLLGQNWLLEDLADACSVDREREGRPATFLLEASPLPITGGLGSPVQPVAIR
ncbi:MAG TPA: cyclase family protein [Acidimicrobiales bacterium]|jgi:kynurenine formamidase